MQYHKTKGFSVVELLISLGIIVILATITVFELRSTNRHDELNTAARQLAADIRAIQSRALAAADTKACDGGGFYAICEATTTACGVNPCETTIPASYGIFLQSGSSTYTLFADLNPIAALDGNLTDNSEALITRSLLSLNSTNVFIDDISTPLSSGVAYVNITFSRQYGAVNLNDPSTPPEPTIVSIRIRHTLSNDTKIIEVNRITGRVSIL